MSTTATSPDFALRSAEKTAVAGTSSFEFLETMSGRCTFTKDYREADAAFTVRCASNDAGAMARGLRTAAGGTLELEGTTTIDGFATKKPSRGTLVMRPLKRVGTLVYDLDFTADDGVAYHLHGEKNVPFLSVLGGMTTLHTEIARASDGVPVARGILKFAMADLVPWLATFRLRLG